MCHTPCVPFWVQNESILVETQRKARGKRPRVDAPAATVTDSSNNTPAKRTQVRANKKAIALLNGAALRIVENLADQCSTVDSTAQFTLVGTFKANVDYVGCSGVSAAAEYTASVLRVTSGAAAAGVSPRRRGVDHLNAASNHYVAQPEQQRRTAFIGTIQAECETEPSAPATPAPAAEPEQPAAPPSH